MASSETPEDMVRTLQTKDLVFQRMFNECVDFINLQPEKRTRSQNIFQQTFPNYREPDLKFFYNEWVIQKVQHSMNETEDIAPSETCPQLVYDGGTKSYLNAQVLPPLNRKKGQEKFNLGEFVRQKRLHGDFHQKSYNDRDSVKDLRDELNEDKPRSDQSANIALNRIVEILAILNANCKYSILELNSERRIH